MPLEKSSSKGAFVRNLKTEIHAGKPRSQALAIAYAVKRRKRADGGEATDADAMVQAARDQLSSQNLRDPAVFDPATYAPTDLDALPSRQQVSKRMPGVTRGLWDMISGAATLPQRAIENSQNSIDTGTYDPSPTLESAMLPMGTGAIAGVPLKVGEMALGSGAVRGVRNRIEKAYNDLGGDAYNFVPLAKLRAHLPDLPRETVDRELLQILQGDIANQGRATLFQSSNPRGLTPADRAAAYSPGGEPFHAIGIGPPRSGAVPTPAPPHADRATPTSVDLSKDFDTLMHGHSSAQESDLASEFADLLGKHAKGGAVSKAMKIAYEAKRQARADGGGVFQGPIISDVPGRTDKHEMDVAAGSYVVPAEAVSHLGENNTLAGMKYLKELGPQGLRKMVRSVNGANEIIRKNRVKKALGGGGVAHDENTGHPVPVVTAGGEQVLTPDEVKVIGDGDITLGHRLLDNWILENRKKHIKTLSKLDGPAHD
jgi:hypothetical protein